MLSYEGRVTSLLAQAVTAEEIAQTLKVNQSTVSRDLKNLKLSSLQFVYDF